MLATATKKEENQTRRVGTASLINYLFDNMLGTSTCEEEESADNIDQEQEIDRAAIDRKTTAKSSYSTCNNIMKPAASSH